MHLVDFIVTRKLSVYSETKLVFLPLGGGSKSFMFEGCGVETALRLALKKTNVPILTNQRQT